MWKYNGMGWDGMVSNSTSKNGEWNIKAHGIHLSGLATLDHFDAKVSEKFHCKK